MPSQQIGVMLRDVVRSLDAMRQSSAFASCCVFTQSMMLSGVVLSRSASYYAVGRNHTLVRNVWCCAIAQCVVLCRFVLSRSASTCVVLLYHALRRIVYCRAITQCVVLCGVTLSRSASYCVLSCYHALRRIVWGLFRCFKRLVSMGAQLLLISIKTSLNFKNE